MKQVELRHLRYFVAVAEELSFGRAAQRLGIAQPPLSQQIADLEVRVGRRLFLRRPRVLLTPAGEALLPAARRQLLLLEQSLEAARRAGGGDGPVLHVGMASSAMLTAIPRRLRRFRAERGEIAIRLRELHSAEQLEQLRAGVLDLAILREPVTDPGLTTRVLVREPLALILPVGHAAARRRTVRVAQVANDPFVLFPRHVAPTLHDQIMAMCREAGFAPRIEQEAREWHTILGLVASGFGVSIAPASVSSLRLRGAVVRRIHPSQARAMLYLAWPKEARLPEVHQLARSLGVGSATSAVSGPRTMAR